MTRSRGLLLAAAVPLLLVSACARADDGGAAAAARARPESTAASRGASVPGGDDLVLRTESFGGFVSPDLVAGRLPQVSVYGDGRVVSEGPLVAMYPAPALPRVLVQTISPELVHELVREGEAAGVRSGADFGHPGVADAPSTRVTVVTAYGPESVTAEALRESRPDDPQLTSAQRAARAKLAAFVDKLAGLPDAQGMPKPVPYDPQILAALARPWVAPAAIDLKADADQAWPGPALPGTWLNPTAKIGCVLVGGALKDRVTALAERAVTVTPWTSGGAQWSITFRPLLPDESGCADLRGDR
jgi:hypothetical protein